MTKLHYLLPPEEVISAHGVTVRINPDGTVGFFRGVLASASKPIKTNYGYVIAFKRTSTTPAV
jgi:hypothetical protein